VGVIAVIGDEEITASLKRAFKHVDYLRKALRAKFSTSAEDKIDIRSYEFHEIENVMNLSYISAMILSNKEEGDNLSLIRDIRFSARESFDSPGLPIILLTLLPSYKGLSPQHAAYFHLKDHGVLLSIPFKISALNDCIRRAMRFDCHLEDIRKSFRRSALLHEYLHEMSRMNYKEKLERIIAVVPAEYRDRVDKLRVRTYEDVKSGLKEVVKEVEMKEKKEDI
jgi:hypothetical protein